MASGAGGVKSNYKSFSCEVLLTNNFIRTVELKVDSEIVRDTGSLANEVLG